MSFAPPLLGARSFTFSVVFGFVSLAIRFTPSRTLSTRLVRDLGAFRRFETLAEEEPARAALDVPARRQIGEQDDDVLLSPAARLLVSFHIAARSRLRV